MTTPKDTFNNRPFEKLDRLLKNKSAAILPDQQPPKEAAFKKGSERQTN